MLSVGAVILASGCGGDGDEETASSASADRREAATPDEPDEPDDADVAEPTDERGPLACPDASDISAELGVTMAVLDDIPSDPGTLLSCVYEDASGSFSLIVEAAVGEVVDLRHDVWCDPDSFDGSDSSAWLHQEYGEDRCEVGGASERDGTVEGFGAVVERAGSEYGCIATTSAFGDAATVDDVRAAFDLSRELVSSFCADEDALATLAAGGPRFAVLDCEETRVDAIVQALGDEGTAGIADFVPMDGIGLEERTDVGAGCAWYFHDARSDEFVPPGLHVFPLVGRPDVTPQTLVERCPEECELRDGGHVYGAESAYNRTGFVYCFLPETSPMQIVRVEGRALDVPLSEEELVRACRAVLAAQFT